jgi:hypothetical protein
MRTLRKLESFLCLSVGIYTPGVSTRLLGWGAPRTKTCDDHTRETI